MILENDLKIHVFLESVESECSGSGSDIGTGIAEYKHCLKFEIKERLKINRITKALYEIELKYERL